MDIKIIGINVVNGEQTFHRMLDSSLQPAKGEENKYEFLPAKTVHSYEELQSFQREKQEEYNKLHPEGCSVYVAYSTDPVSRAEIKKIEFALTDLIESM